MKFEISDFVVNDFVLDLVSEATKYSCREIINDTSTHTHPDDVTYYRELRDAATKIYQHHAEPGDAALDIPQTTIEIDFEDEEFMWVAMYAHERDITLNQAINDILSWYIEHGNYDE